MNKKDFFNKTKDIKTLTQKFDYIKKHFSYDTLNSWNGLKSIANNVKIYNLGLTTQQEDKFFQILEKEETCEDLYFYINNILEEFTQIYKDYFISFNGRSGGYLVLYNKKNNGNVINNYILDYETKQDLINCVKDDYISYKDCLQDIKNIINEDFDFVKDFDAICDKARQELIYILDNATIEEHTQQIEEKFYTLSI